MTITFSVPDTGFTIDGRLVLLFRDNVQHHLQAGLPGPGYPMVHALGDAALEQLLLRLPARSLWMEATLAAQGMAAVGIHDLAVSLRTRAVLTGSTCLPAVRGTLLFRVADWRVPIVTRGAHTLGELFAGFVAKLDALTDAGRRSGLVDVCSWQIHSPAALAAH